MQHVEVKIHEEVATVLMDRPKVRNALNPQLIESLRLALSDVHQEQQVRAIILSGTGDHFCSGLDLRVLYEISQLPPTEASGQWYTIWRDLTDLYEDLLRFPKPIIAAVDGAAYGAGLGLALAADMVVASDRAQFCASAVHRGLVGGATAALVAFRVGASLAARMTLTGMPIDAGEAYRLGLCGEPVAPDQIWVRAREIAKPCCMGSREAIQASKRVLNESIGETLLMQLSAGATDSATACTTESAAVGIGAFLDDRLPDWPR